MANEELSSEASILERASDFFRRSVQEGSWRIANSALGFLAAGAIFPFLVEDPKKALATLLGAASVEILTKWLMQLAGEKEPDSGELIAAVKEQLDTSEEIRRAVEELVAKIGGGELAARARGVLSAEDEQWFMDTLFIELFRYAFHYIQIRGDFIWGDRNIVVVVKDSEVNIHYYGTDKATLSMEVRREQELQASSEMFKKIRRYPLVVVLLGPGQDNGRFWLKRLTMKEMLEAEGHVAIVPELLAELEEGRVPNGLKLFWELAMFDEADLCIALYAYEASGVQEELDRLREVPGWIRKTVVCWDSEHRGGLFYDELVAENVDLCYYEFDQDIGPECNLLAKLTDRIQRESSKKWYDSIK